MAFLRSWWLPAVLVCGQLLLWPFLVLTEGERPHTIQLMAGVMITLVLGGALGWRMRAPVGALAVTVVTLTAGVLVLPRDSLTLIALADIIILFSVATRRPSRTTAIATAGVLVGQFLQIARTPQDALVGASIALLACVLTVSLGRVRRRWRHARDTAARRLALAEIERGRAAEAERQRLARELHDVTAHHLTAIVVHAAAAKRLAKQRPELVTQALDFAADTGRRTLTALHRLVAVIAPVTAGEPLADRLSRLTAAAAKAGQTLRVEPVGRIADVRADTADAVYALVREAATNAMRYAPGAAVTAGIVVADDGIEVSVDNDAVTLLGAERLGSGRGLVGLASRMAELGGSLEAGTRPEGGWRVRAELPHLPGGFDSAAADGAGWEYLGTKAGLGGGGVRDAALSRPPAASREPIVRHWLRAVFDEHLLDVATIGTVIVLPLLLLLVNNDDPELRPFQRSDMTVLVTLLIVLHGAPVWWRRQAPWRALGGVLAGTMTYSVVMAVVPLDPGAIAFILLAVGADVVAVYAVAAYGRPKLITWVAIPVAVAAWAMVTAVTFVLSDEVRVPHSPSETVWRVVAPALITTAIPGVLLFFPVWLLGTLLRRRRERTLAAEAEALALAARNAAQAALDQRVRFAAGLHASVLEPARRLVVAADRGHENARLDAVDRVIAEARAGLAAMRELLGALSPQSPAGAAPPRGTGDLGALAAELRAVGREVTLVTEPAPYPLPVAVDLSGYRIVDAALDTDDVGACEITVGFAENALVVTVVGVPAAVDGVVAARIRARVAALGGMVCFDPAGAVTVRLPAPREEVSTSPFV